MAQPLNIGILIYPNVTQLDATGPAQVFIQAEVPLTSGPALLIRTGQHADPTLIECWVLP